MGGQVAAGTRWGRWAAVVATALLATAGVAPGSDRTNVRRAMRTAPAMVGLGQVATGPYQNAADALLEGGVRNLPIHPTMFSGSTFRWDPSCDCYHRVSADLGPWFLTERADTVGQGLLNVSVTVGEYDMTCVNGCKAGEEFDPVAISVAAVRLAARKEMLYTVTTVNLTYGVTNDFDVNIAIPVGALDFGQNVSRQDGPSGPRSFASRHFDVGPNVMDMMVRAKYRIFDTAGFTGAAGLRVRIPTGDPARGFGTGYGEIGPYAALSTTYFDGLLDSHMDAGFDVQVSEPRLSSAHYSWTMGLQAPPDSMLGRVSLVGGVAGRSEIDGIRAGSSVSGPHVTPLGVVNEPYLCLDPDRHDYFDAVLGLRVRMVRSLVMSLGVFKPINTGEGVRPEGWSPVGSIEATF